MEPRSNRARARNQVRPTHRSPHAALRPSIVHDGRRRPAAVNGSSVHARRQREQQHMYAQRNDGDFNKTHIISTRNLIISEPTVHDP